jgi:hypothetical protein
MRYEAERRVNEREREREKNVFLTYGARFLLKCLDSTNDSFALHIFRLYIFFSFFLSFLLITLPYSSLLKNRALSMKMRERGE